MYLLEANQLYKKGMIGLNMGKLKMQVSQPYLLNLFSISGKACAPESTLPSGRMSCRACRHDSLFRKENVLHEEAVWQEIISKALLLA